MIKADPFLVYGSQVRPLEPVTLCCSIVGCEVSAEATCLEVFEFAGWQEFYSELHTLKLEPLVICPNHPADARVLAIIPAEGRA